MSRLSKLEFLYPKLPAWAQNIAISLYGLSYRRERLGGSFQTHCAGFMERDGFSSDQMQAFLETALNAVLLSSYDSVPHYRRVWSEYGLTRDDVARITPSDLHRLPITRKEELRAQPDDFVSNAIPAHDLLRYTSSGSSGTPVTCICTPDDHRRFIAVREARSFGWAGTSVRHKRSTLGGRRILPIGGTRAPFHRINYAEDQIYLSAYNISPETIPEYVKALNAFQPKVFTGYAHAHFLLAQLIRERGLSIDYQPEALILGSEKLTAEMKSVLQEVFHARAYEEYGSVENCVLATECSHGSLHVSPDFGILEIVDDEGRPLPAGNVGRVVATGLMNAAQPLIRYEIGDRAAISTEPCGCGRNPLPVLREVVGRIEDEIVAPDGRRTVRFHWLYIGVPNVREGQLIQETLHSIRLRIVPTRDFGPADSDMLRDRLRKHLGDVEVTVETVPEIPRTERGKFKAVISRVSSAEAAEARLVH